VRQDDVVDYAETLIAVAGDRRAATGAIPPERAAGPTVASTQYAILTAARTVGRRGRSARILSAGSPHDVSETEFSRLREEYFARPRACLRASPLSKTFGWGVHFDADGRVTLHAVDSPEYAQLSIDPSLTQLRAMRSSRDAG
jgi:hypothetical protein